LQQLMRPAFFLMEPVAYVFPVFSTLGYGRCSYPGIISERSYGGNAVYGNGVPQAGMPCNELYQQRDPGGLHLKRSPGHGYRYSAGLRFLGFPEFCQSFSPAFRKSKRGNMNTATMKTFYRCIRRILLPWSSKICRCNLG